MDEPPEEGAVAYEEPTWGLVEPGELARIAVVSPHFDDAVLSCWHLLESLFQE